MSYSSDFLAWLQLPAVTVRFLVESISVALDGNPDSIGPGDGDLLLTSAPLTGYTLGIDANSVEFPSMNVELPTCHYSGGQWSFRFAPNNDTARDAILSLRRGTVLVLKMGAPSFAATEHEAVALGRVQSIVRDSTGAFLVTVWDLVSTVVYRIATGTGDYADALYSGGGDTTIAVSNYTPGDSILGVADETVFARDSVSGLYAALVTPTTGDPFWLTATGTSTNQLTGVVYRDYAGTDTAALIGDTVTPGALYSGHPMTLFERVMVSEGSGGHGTYDTLPPKWGLGISDDWFDSSARSTWSAILTPSTGTCSISYHLTSVPDGGYQDFIGVLSLFGCWPVFRQGQYSCRGLQDLFDSPITSSVIIDSGHVLSWTVEAETITNTYMRVYAICDATNDLEVISGASWSPLETEHTLDLSSVLYSNESAVLNNITGRFWAWLNLGYETFTLTCQRRFGIILCPGDIVTLDCPNVKGRYLSTRDGLVATVARPDMLAMVIGVQGGLSSSTVTVVVPPVDATDANLV